MADEPINRRYWTGLAGNDAFPSMTGNVSVDVAIIGGGRRHFAARLLKDQGPSVAISEAARIPRCRILAALRLPRPLHYEISDGAHARSSLLLVLLDACSVLHAGRSGS